MAVVTYALQVTGAANDDGAGYSPHAGPSQDVSAGIPGLLSGSMYRSAAIEQSDGNSLHLSNGTYYAGIALTTDASVVALAFAWLRESAFQIEDLMTDATGGATVPTITMTPGSIIPSVTPASNPASLQRSSLPPALMGQLRDAATGAGMQTIMNRKLERARPSFRKEESVHG